MNLASPAEALAKEGQIKAIEVVLKNFSKDEQEKINSAINKTIEALNAFIENGLEKTMNEYNK